MYNLYGDLPSLKMEIDKGGWSKPPPLPPPSPFAKAASLLPVKLVTPSRPITTANTSITSTEGSSSISNDTSTTSANAFKPRQAFIPSSLKTISTQPSKGLSTTITTSSVTVKSENQDKGKDNSEQSQANISQSSTSTSSSIHTTKIETTNLLKNYSLSTADESNLPGASFDVTDAYDPYKPNDYLAYCQERLEAKRIKKLEEANQKKFLELEKIRLDKEKERTEAIESGDFQKLQSTISSGGRGRGGLSNLPAWMTSTGSGTTAEVAIAPGLGSSTSKSSSSSSSYGLEMSAGLGHHSSSNTKSSSVTSDKRYGNDNDDDDVVSDDDSNNIYGPSNSNNMSPRNRSDDSYSKNDSHDDKYRGHSSSTDAFGRSTHQSQSSSSSASSSLQVKSSKPWLANSKYANDSDSDGDKDDDRKKRGRSGSIGCSSNSNQRNYDDRGSSSSSSSSYDNRDYKKQKSDIDTTTTNSSSNRSSSTASNNTATTTAATAAAVLKPTCILLLQNMVAADEVDEDLTDEVKQECEKYGPVLSCRIYVVPSSSCLVPVNPTPMTSAVMTIPEEERVRLFVQFARQDCAVRAYKEMNGRYFGGRRITAGFYDEGKFHQQDLAP